MELITTADGSHTLYSPQFNEIYHSRHGAIQESSHVFIQSGINYVIDRPGIDTINIFEVGFGTGLNALLTLAEADKRGIKVNYTTIELFPVALETVKALNYPQLIENEKYRQPFHTMHLCIWNSRHAITPYFIFKKIQGNLIETQLPAATCHLIYFDAFSPEHQPEMWTPEVMQKMYSLLQAGGVLVSYCSKSVFQKALKGAGFMVEKIPGPPGKREMVRAVKAVTE